jgi:VanZ family protein
VLLRVPLVSEASSAGLGFLSHRFWPAAASLWTASVLALALGPQAEQSWLLKTFGDKLLHGAAFTVGAVIWIRTIELWPRLSFAGSLAGGSVAALIVGAAIELLQRYVPGRTPDIRDLASDAAGILLALLFLALLPRARPPTSV